MVTVAKHTFLFYFNVYVHRLVYTVAAPANLSNCTANIIATKMINSYNVIVLTGPVHFRVYRQDLNKFCGSVCQRVTSHTPVD